MISIAALAFSTYLFSVGCSICYHYVFMKYHCDDYVSDESSAEQLLECHLSSRDFMGAQSWTSLTLFCIVCTATVLLLIGIISMGLNMIFRHYVKYWLWSKSHFKVTIKPYVLQGAAATPLSDAI